MPAPTVSIRSVTVGTTRSANTGHVEVTWSVSGGPTAVWLGFGQVGMEVLPDGVFPDSGGGSSNVFPTTSGSLTADVGRTSYIHVSAVNADGVTDDREWLFSKIRVGYHGATVPGAPVRQRDLDRVRGYLEEIDHILNANALTNLPAFLAEFNRRVPAGEGFPAFGDIAYLSGGVGTGSLTDDILSAMQEVLIYLGAATMPRGWRPGTIAAAGRRALCEGGVLGIATREWVSICLEGGADALTLLHELFHHASTSNNGDEARAFAISMCAYNLLP
jgi:hypothetical protein